VHCDDAGQSGKLRHKARRRKFRRFRKSQHLKRTLEVAEVRAT
jgi:hypothetical protein